MTLEKDITKARQSNTVKKQHTSTRNQIKSPPANVDGITKGKEKILKKTWRRRRKTPKLKKLRRLLKHNVQGAWVNHTKDTMSSQRIKI